MNQIFKTTINLSIIIFLIPTAILAQSESPEKAFTTEKESANLEWGPCPEFMPESCSISVLQGDPSQPNTDIFFKMQGNTKVPNHWHNSAERMVLIAGEMTVDYEGQSPVTITTGEYAYGPPELPHTASCESSEPCVLFIAFNEPVDAFEK
ncbi:MAG: cupin domain-containing protein [Balneolaceae bacterium]|nr:cupin domain-containing protein [Balneolaceae bacterium]